MNIEELRSLEAAATAAPWKVNRDMHYRRPDNTLIEGPDYSGLWMSSPGYFKDADAALIVALRNAAPALLQLLEDARKEISDMAADAHAAEHNHLTDFMECMTATCQLRVALLARFEEVRS